MSKNAVGKELFALAEQAQSKGWSAEALLRMETNRRERALRRQERAQGASSGLAAASVIPGVWVARRALLAGQLYT